MGAVYLLLPCTIDSLGFIGPIFASLFLGDSSPHLTHPPNICYSTSLHQAGLSALAHATHADSPTGLFPAANAAWRQSRPDNPDSTYDTWFTNTYHATTPSHWATQVLGFNLTEALASHFYRAEQTIARSNDSIRSTLNPRDIIQYPSVMMPRLLRRYPHLSPAGAPTQ